MAEGKQNSKTSESQASRLGSACRIAAKGFGSTWSLRWDGGCLLVFGPFTVLGWLMDLELTRLIWIGRWKSLLTNKQTCPCVLQSFSVMVAFNQLYNWFLLLSTCCFWQCLMIDNYLMRFSCMQMYEEEHFLPHWLREKSSSYIWVNMVKSITPYPMYILSYALLAY